MTKDEAPLPRGVGRGGGTHTLAGKRNQRSE